MSSIFRIKKNDNFVVMDKAFLNNPKLSWKAKGILAFMLSKPDDWTFYIDELIKHSTDGERSFRSGFKELTDNGYVKRKPIRKGQRIERWETIVYENPELCSFVHVQNEQVQNEDVQSVHVQNEALLINNNTKNDSTNNNNTKNEDIYTLYELWNSKVIIKHRKLTDVMKRNTNARLNEYSFEELRKAIDNYKNILDSNNHYWTHKWTFDAFMKPSNVTRFLDEADPFNNYKKNNQTNGQAAFVPMDARYDPTVDRF